MRHVYLIGIRDRSLLKALQAMHSFTHKVLGVSLNRIEFLVFKTKGVLKFNFTTVRESFMAERSK